MYWRKALLHGESHSLKDNEAVEQNRMALFTSVDLLQTGIARGLHQFFSRIIKFFIGLINALILKYLLPCE